MATHSTFVSRAVDHWKQAVERDNTNDLPAAYGEYLKGLQYAMAGLRYAKDEQASTALKAKIAQIMDRAEAIKAHLGSAEADRIAKASIPNAQVMSGCAPPAARSEEPQHRPQPVAPVATFADTPCTASIRQQLQAVVDLPAAHPQLFTGVRTPWQAVLLHGPHHGGKRRLAHALAAHAGGALFELDCMELVAGASRVDHRARLLLRECTACYAATQKHSVLLLHDVDAVTAHDNGASRRAMEHVMALVRGLQGTTVGTHIVAVTAEPWNVSPRLLRCFDMHLVVGVHCDVASIDELVRWCVRDVPHLLTDDAIRSVAERMVGWGTHDIVEAMRRAALRAMQRTVSAVAFKRTARDDSAAALVRWTPCSPADPAAVEHQLGDFAPEEVVPAPVTDADVLMVLAPAPSAECGDGSPVATVRAPLDDALRTRHLDFQRKCLELLEG